MARRPSAPRPAAPRTPASRSGASRPAAPGAESPRPGTPRPSSSTAPSAPSPSASRTSAASATSAASPAEPAGTDRPVVRTAGDARSTTGASRPGRARRSPSGTSRRPSGGPSSSRPAARAGGSDDAAAPAPRGGGRAVGRPRTEDRTATSEQTTRQSGRAGGVIQAADRFRDLVRARPWRRRRRAILVTAAIVVALLVVALVAAVTLPALSVRQVQVEGLGYVQESAVDEAVEPFRGDSVLLLGTGAVESAVEEVPGVATAEVHRSWPDGMSITVTERTAIASVTQQDGATVLLDAEGTELPEGAGEGASPVPLTVAADAADPDGAQAAMIDVLAEMPSSLRKGMTGMTASSPSDVSFTLELEDGGTKTIVWGDAADADLKAEVVRALLAEPGSEIDVSSPVAPVTR